MKGHATLSNQLQERQRIVSIMFFLLFFASVPYGAEQSMRQDPIPELIPYPSPTYEQQPTLQWFKPTVNVTTYYIQIGLSTSFTSPIIFVSVPDTQYTSPIELPVDTIYWRVKADSANWSETGTFTIKDKRIPVLIPYGSPTYEQKPTLNWHRPPVPVVSYTLQVAADSLFITTEVDVPVTDTSYTCQADLPLGMIYWRVKSGSSEYSDISTFEIKDIRVPVLIPFDSELTIETKPVLLWYKVENALSYTVEIDNNNDFSSTIMSLPISDTSFIPFEALPIGDIYWRVKSNLVNDWSDVSHFIILPDTIPFLIRYNGGAIADKKPTFAWHPVQDADSYKMLLADNVNFNNATTVPKSDTSYTPDIDLEWGTWYWKVSCSKNFDIYSPVDSVVLDSLVTFIQKGNNFHKHRLRFYKLHSSVRIEMRGLNSNNYFLQVYNLNGKCIKTLKITTNNRVLYWDYTDTRGNTVASGMYVLVIKTREELYSYKMFFSNN